MSRSSKRSFADFFPTAPSVLQEKKRAARDRQRVGDQPGDVVDGSLSNSQTVQTSSADGILQERRPAMGRDVDGAADHDDRQSHNGDSGDLLNGVGSASSHNSTHSSVFSAGGPAALPTLNGAGAASSELTPLTSHESPAPDRLSPHTGKSVASNQGNGNAYVCTPQSPQRPREVSPIMTPPASSQPTRLSARPGPGESKGLKATYNPELDPEINPREARKLKPRYREFDEDRGPPPDPRLSVSGYKSGHLNIRPSQVSKTWKFRLRPAPYVMTQYSFDPATSVGPGPPTAIVVTGFDPFTPDAQLKALFSTYGEIAELDNKTDPSTGTFLGICSIKYRDSRAGRVPAVPAAAAAKKAEGDETIKRIGTRTVKAERDRGGAKCKRYVEHKVRKNKELREKEAREDTRKIPPPPPPPPNAPPPLSTSSEPTPAPPVNAPKGPSRLLAALGPVARSTKDTVVETEPILSSIKRKPYCFISAKDVPVMPTTVPHLKRRLKMAKFEEVRVDKSGYFVIFEDHKRGEVEARNCYNLYNREALFDYYMAMECQEYGNPHYERSPSPERAIAMKRKREEEERQKKEDEMDIEEEKKQRALDLDPVIAALEQILVDVNSKVLTDVKERMAGPALYDFLEPSKHAEKRRKLGIADPNIQTASSTYLNLSEAASLDKSPSRFKAPYGSSIARIQRQELRQPMQASNNVFVDERRQQRRQKRKIPTSLHQRLQDAYAEDEESDDERRTARTGRETEDQESRPASRMSSHPRTLDRDDESHRTPSRHAKEETPHEEDSADESSSIAKSTLDPGLLKKEVEEMTVRELQQIIKSLPSPVKLHKRAKAEVFARKQAKEDERLFRDKFEESKDQTPHTGDEETAEDHDMGDIVESTEFLEAVAKGKKKPAKTSKKKSKKQLFEEKEAEKAKVKLLPQVYEQVPIPETHALDDIDIAEVLVEKEEEEEPRAEVEWGVSTEAPRRTVEDDMDAFFDIDGWQYIIKDAEDLHFLKEALAGHPRAEIEDANGWAFGQKSIKNLHNGVPVIEGYFVPNPSGSARTEGVKRILETEKSKYLPHRIKVAKARERREAEAERVKNNPMVAAEAARQAKLASTATSRTNRANNRTQIKDINTAKQNLAAEGQQGDAIRFNQLKKRKKLVKFDRSAIHGWGLYAEENIAMSDMIIEYVGEKVRQAVANVRELRYDKQGMGSSYLFRIDEDTVVDATKKGGIARFINHSCAPNCTAKIIRVDDELRIGIYSKSEIRKGDELTYDYKFDREADDEMRVPCLCGSDVCKGFLN